MITLTRDSDRSLRVLREDGWFRTTFETVFWDPDRDFAVGDMRRAGGMVAQVVAVTPDGRPREVRFTFDVPLEDPSLRFMRVGGDGSLVATRPPRLDEAVEVSPAWP